VRGGSRPFGGSTIFEVRAPVRLVERKAARLYAPLISRSVAKRLRVADRVLSNSARCASVKNSWFANSAGRCNAVSNSSVQIP
jgi:hypothetical protein